MAKIPFFLVNSTPKCGSTYLASVVCHAVGGVTAYGGELQMEVEQDFSIFGLQRTLRVPEVIVYKHHALPNALNIMAIQSCGMGYVNMTRSVFDTMVSVHDHLLRGENANKVSIWPGQKLRGFSDWSEGARYHYIAHFIMPWYFRFVDSWSRFDNMSVVYYEEMILQPKEFYRKISVLLGIDYHVLMASSEVEHRNTRKNVGKIGRGESLRAEYREHFLGFLRYFPMIDPEFFVP